MHRIGWYKATQLALGKDMVADFMTHFPAYIWRDTITNCRNHMLKHMKVTRLDDAFPKLVDLVSPVNVIFNYAYYFENDRYDWHLDVNKDLAAYNLKQLPRGVNIKPSETLPEVRVTVHETYYRKPKERNPLLQGYCVAKRYVGPLPANCQAFENVINFQLFEFGWFPGIIQSHISTWCGSDEGRRDCVRRLEAHYKNVKTYYNLGWFDLNLRRVRAVEKLAAQENTSCPKILDFDKSGTATIVFA
ncbi:uncharacterized protein LOC110980175 [Acanthaster planci]|uniref:Uncharacterized protein LOC110980175 n=1 Tax=Acanthaster planci TaxID=133434 RepID=A0A8B7YG98_ACAPL|nr:uncharacterized protein LOC110980175 [Acanthaster planci]